MTLILSGTTGVTSVNGTAAAPSVTGTDTDTGIVYGTNTLSLATGGTTAMTIDSSQKVAFAAGVTGGLNVSGAGWGVLPYVANSTVIDNNSGQTRLFAVGANTSTYGTLLSYAGTTNGSATLLTTVGKDLTFALQGGTQSSGTGIAFPATQSASTNANTLDDYEEGTWTPVYAATSGSITTSSNAGTYVKVGKMVTVSGNLRSTGVSGISGVIYITGLPFTAGNTSGADRFGGVRAYARSWNADMPNFQMYLGQNMNFIDMYKQAMNAGGASQVSTSDFATGSDNNVLEFSLTYFTA